LALPGSKIARAAILPHQLKLQFFQIEARRRYRRWRFELMSAPRRDCCDRLDGLYASRKRIGTGPGAAKFSGDGQIGHNYRIV
jgi:hypothetical protein